MHMMEHHIHTMVVNLRYTMVVNLRYTCGYPRYMCNASLSALLMQDVLPAAQLLSSVGGGNGSSSSRGRDYNAIKVSAAGCPQLHTFRMSDA
jgi:hypothetical protein